MLQETQHFVNDLFSQTPCKPQHFGHTCSNNTLKPIDLTEHHGRGPSMNPQHAIDWPWFELKMTERGINQSDLAKIFGKNRAVVTLVKQGKRPIRAHELPKLCATLGVTADEIMAHTTGLGFLKGRIRRVGGSADGTTTIRVELVFEPLSPVSVSKMGVICLAHLEDGQKLIGAVKAAFAGGEVEFQPLVGPSERCRVATVGRLLSVRL